MVMTEVKAALAASGQDAVDQMAAVASDLGLAALVIDGADVGAPGWVFLRAIGDGEDSTLLRHAGDSQIACDLPWDALREGLVSAFEVEAHVAVDLKAGPHRVPEDGIFALGGEVGAVAVCTAKGQMPGVLAATIEADIVTAPIGPWLLASRVTPPTEEELVEDFSSGSADLAGGMGAFRAPSLALYRRGATTAFVAARKGKIVGHQLWGPRWKVVAPAGAHRHELGDFVSDVASDLSFSVTDGKDVAKAFGLDWSGAARLAEVLEGPELDAAALVAVLGLPHAVADVYEGSVRVADLPGAVLHATGSTKAAIAQEMKPKWLRGKDR